MKKKIALFVIVFLIAICNISKASDRSEPIELLWEDNFYFVTETALKVMDLKTGEIVCEDRNISDRKIDSLDEYISG